MTPEVRALLNTIRYAEGTWKGGSQDGYRVMFGGGLADPRANAGKHPDRVINGGRVSSAAAGAYQFMPDTWAAASKAIGARPDQFFDPATQDRAAAHLAQRRLAGTKLGDSLTPEVASKLAPEWASFPTRSGSSYYPNQSVKRLGELDSFYRSQLTSLRGGGTGAAPTPSGGEAGSGAGQASGGSTELTVAPREQGNYEGLAKALFGVREQRTEEGGTRMADAGAMDVVPGLAVKAPGRMAGSNPFVAAVADRPGGDETDDVLSSVVDRYTEHTEEVSGPGATRGLAGIASAADKSFGMNTKTGPDGGNNACLYAVNKVLSQAGKRPPWGNSQWVPDARRALADGKGVLLAKAEPGAIAIMRDRASKDPYPHIGVVGSDGLILSNSSS